LKFKKFTNSYDVLKVSSIIAFIQILKFSLHIINQVGYLVNTLN